MTDPNIRTDIDADGILLATIDMPGRTMNVFSADMMASLEALMKRVEQDASIKGVVLTSGKPAFIAGADLDMIRMFTEQARTGSTKELHELFGHLGRLFRRLELSRKPYVAAINGLALGGGLEVSLACHERVAADDKGVQLGLPEIKLGLLPGAGGTQRLPRLIGTEKGLEMLLTGEPVGSQQALALGLVDEVVAPDQLVPAARRRAKVLSAPQARWDRSGARFDARPFDFSNRNTAFASIAKAIGISDYQLKYYPAYNAIIDCVVGGWNLPMTEASTREMDIFVELMRDPVAGNMVRTLFLNRQKAAKAGLLAPTSVYAEGGDSLLVVIKAAKDRAKSLKLSEEETVLATALAALRASESGKAEQPELADVAVVTAGLVPSYTGGPFTYLRQHGGTRVRELAAAAARHDPELFTVPGALEALAAA
ncbi:enoyl-CoA hydratase-related protein [Hydrocarboniphaga sp.]|uniref:enoyl-CoA hydratase-related protein n=1 Tax=Hydrocarboniphaga sp. TaxID=2033016 RepID=UPI003D12BA77